MRSIIAFVPFWIALTFVGSATAEETAKPKVREVAAWRARTVEKARFGWIAPFWKKHAAVNLDGNCSSAAKCEGGKWGYYSSVGKLGLEAKFDAPGTVSTAGVVVKLGGRFGFVTWGGTFIIEPRFSALRRHDNGYFIGLVPEMGGAELVDTAGRTVFRNSGELAVHQDQLVWASRGERWGAFDLAGNPVVPQRFHEVFNLENGLVAVRAGGNWALFDGTGRRITALMNHNFETTNDDYFPFNRGGEACDNSLYSCSGGRFGVMHRSGKIVVPARYDCVSVYDSREDGTDIVVVSHDRPPGPEYEARCSGGRWQLLKADGTPYAIGNFSYVEPYYGLEFFRFAQGGTCDSDGHCTGAKWGMIGRQGQVVAPPIYDWLHESDDNPMAFVRDGRWGFIGDHFAEVVPPKYELVQVDDQVVRFRDHGKWGVMDPTGKVLVPATYEIVLPFVDGRARFRQNGKWGLIDATGKVLAKAAYGVICAPRQGTYLFSQTPGCGLRQGRELLENELDLPSGKIRLEGSLNADCSCDGASFGLLGPDGREVLPAKYAAIVVSSALLLSEDIDWKLATAPTIDVPVGQVWVRINRGGACNRALSCTGGSWGLADRAGRILLKPEHAYLEPQADLWFTFASGGSCVVQGAGVESCTPQTKWGLLKLEPVAP